MVDTMDPGEWGKVPDKPSRLPQERDIRPTAGLAQGQGRWPSFGLDIPVDGGHHRGVFSPFGGGLKIGR